MYIIPQKERKVNHNKELRLPPHLKRRGFRREVFYE